jgi:hypothetical protein
VVGGCQHSVDTCSEEAACPYDNNGTQLLLGTQCHHSVTAISRFNFLQRCTLLCIYQTRKLIATNTAILEKPLIICNLSPINKLYTIKALGIKTVYFLKLCDLCISLVSLIGTLADFVGVNKQLLEISGQITMAGYELDTLLAGKSCYPNMFNLIFN